MRRLQKKQNKKQASQRRNNFTPTSHKNSHIKNMKTEKHTGIWRTTKACSYSEKETVCEAGESLDCRQNRGAHTLTYAQMLGGRSGNMFNKEWEKVGTEGKDAFWVKGHLLSPWRCQSLASFPIARTCQPAKAPSGGRKHQLHTQALARIYSQGNNGTHTAITGVICQRRAASEELSTFFHVFPPAVTIA